MNCDVCGKPLGDDPEIIEFGRHPKCDREMVDLGPLFQPWEATCRICGAPITNAELCPECAKGNDPFFTSKYSGDHRP
ncbi:MAG TPA: hypothetical protein VJN70_12560 [Gemmatimonadaceae bacterium]|nr:hypothetical protein [Gemmatimonadaceae bacterium]